MEAEGGTSRGMRQAGKGAGRGGDWAGCRSRAEKANRAA